jgi:hypothetical protein
VAAAAVVVVAVAAYVFRNFAGYCSITYVLEFFLHAGPMFTVCSV